MEWIKCNNCCLKIVDKRSSFFLTQCGHIFCDKCIATAEQECYQCASTKISSLPIKKPINSEIAHYFMSASDILEKFLQTELFHQVQLDLSLKNFDYCEMKYQRLKKNYWIGVQNFNKIYHNYSKLKTYANAIHKQRKNEMNASFVSPTSSNESTSNYYTPPNQIGIDSSKCYAKTNQNNASRNNYASKVPVVLSSGSSGSYYYARSHTSRSNSSISASGFSKLNINKS